MFNTTNPVNISTSLRSAVMVSFISV
jgi:protein-arginine kinase